MSDRIKVLLPKALQGVFAQQALEAAAELGIDPSTIRTQQRGLVVPAEVFHHLYPSSVQDTPDAPPPADPVVLDPAVAEAVQDFADDNEADGE